MDRPDAPLVITFAAPSTLLREQPRPSDLPIVGNGPPGTFVVFSNGLRVSLPTDQIVGADDEQGHARVAFGGMRFVGVEGERLVFVREREVLPDALLSPARSHVMYLEIAWVALVISNGRQVWLSEGGREESSGDSIRAPGEDSRSPNLTSTVRSRRSDSSG